MCECVNHTVTRLKVKKPAFARICFASADKRGWPFVSFLRVLLFFVATLYVSLIRSQLPGKRTQLLVSFAYALEKTGRQNGGEAADW